MDVTISHLDLVILRGLIDVSCRKGYFLSVALPVSSWTLAAGRSDEPRDQRHFFPLADPVSRHPS